MDVDAAPGGRSLRFLALYVLANAGGVFAYHPLLTLLLPFKLGAMVGVDRLGLLTLTALGGAVAASLSNIVFGALSDRTHAGRGARRPWIKAGLALTIASYGAIRFAASPAAVVASVITFQTALNMMLAPLAAMMVDEVPDDVKGFVAGLLTFAAPLSSIAGGALMTMRGLGETGRFAVLCAGVATMVLPLMLFPPTPAAPRVETLPPTIRAVRRVDLALVWVARLLPQIANNVLFTYLLFFFHGVTHDHDPLALASWVGRISGTVFLLSAPLAVVAGRLSDRSGRRKPFLVGAALVTAAGLVAMALADARFPAVIGFGLFAGGSSVFFALLSAYAMQILPSPAHRGRDLGVLNLTNTLPALLGPALTWSLARGENFAVVLLTLAGLSVLGGLLVLPVRSRG